MKRTKVVFVLVIFLILSACSKDDSNSEWIRVADMTERPVVVTIITDRNQINNINQVTEALKWQDRQIETTGDSHYQFWLDRKRKNSEITHSNSKVRSLT